MKKTKFHVTAMLGMMMISFSACDGMFDGIYDSYGLITAENCESMTVDATDYTKWTYINLETQESVCTRILDETGAEEPWEEGGSMPDDWDIAIHRYDVKTNGGSVLETSCTSISELLDSGSIPDGEYVSDTETTDRITIDMSGMMDGVILYAQSDYNETLSKWLNVDTSTMPPIYTMSNKIYVLRLQDGTHAAIHLLGYANEQNTKGHMTFEYLYPLENAFN